MNNDLPNIKLSNKDLPVVPVEVSKAVFTISIAAIAVLFIIFAAWFLV